MADEQDVLNRMDKYMLNGLTSSDELTLPTPPQPRTMILYVGLARDFFVFDDE